ncbi:hypothetical protein CW751_03275 [Brumimicrobium salinarum]|uniref:Uncharacterized protein n=1 Tax=Brumimicrobium salinarum TaxID=2058658 RepID=A0A2I0R4T3_9FLAO|nr:hypothetical protein [Brumimicrobium salinarum]PKR81559.1 hypothetical protein CW751_03275 [Brumimicrobium salinarum]
MASVRNLKKNVNNMIYDVVDECYSLQLFNESKKEETDAFIDDAADFQEEIMGDIKKANNKADYKAIEEKVVKTQEEWITRLNKMQ